jgi:MoaA/NifB/PqqE/SkfB family radical SAM enzyme
MYKDIKDHVAVSSLESPIHAVRKDPKIITVVWFLGKRCNYDCSYCASYIHDNYSPHIKKKDAYNFLDQIESYILSQKKQFKLNITGGEPFVHPDFLDILEYAKKKTGLMQLSVVTNGSLPLKNYQKSSEYLDNITVSLHVEQDIKIVWETVNKIIELNNIKKWFLNVNLMAAPTKFNLLKEIIDKFKKFEIKFVLRKIDPPFENSLEIIKKKDLPNDLKELKNLEENFIKEKIKRKKIRDEFVDSNYYTKEEIEFLSNFKNDEQWQNIKIHYPDKHVEMNTDELKARSLNSWKGWQCYVGIDSIYVQHNGMVFRSNCMQGEPLGKIGGKLNWPSQPIICPIKWCTCNTDMCVRKVKNKKFDELIND